MRAVEVGKSAVLVRNVSSGGGWLVMDIGISQEEAEIKKREYRNRFMAVVTVEITDVNITDFDPR